MDYDYKTPTAAEMHAIELEARALRAQAIADMFAGLGTTLAALRARIGHALRGVAHG